MRQVYISARADSRLGAYIRSRGYEVVPVEASGAVYDAISAHPDVYMCAVGGRLIHAEPGEPGFDYPGCAAFNAVCLDRYFIHNLKYTNPYLLRDAEAAGRIPVNVKQGYTKCSVAVVDGCSVITADAGIAAALKKLGDVDVLTVTPGHVHLPGFESGFIGGASGRVGDELIFSGDLSTHPDFEAIRAFTLSRGVALKFFPEYPLEDVGSIIEA